MQLTDTHIKCIKDYLLTNSQTQSYTKYLGTGNVGSDRVMASKFFRRSEVKAMLAILKDVREKAIITAIKKNYEEIYLKEVASELELDILHTKIIRGQVEVEEIFPVKEIKTIEENGKLMKVETTVFKREKRRPSVLEVQRSAKELYLRKGSYKALKIDTNPDDQKAAEEAKGNQPTERTFLLSDGSKLPMSE